jgi:hypothetical protein
MALESKNVEQIEHDYRVVPYSPLVMDIIRFWRQRVFGVDQRFDMGVGCKRIFLFLKQFHGGGSLRG